MLHSAARLLAVISLAAGQLENPRKSAFPCDFLWGALFQPARAEGDHELFNRVRPATPFYLQERTTRKNSPRRSGPAVVTSTHPFLSSSCNYPQYLTTFYGIIAKSKTPLEVKTQHDCSRMSMVFRTKIRHSPNVEKTSTKPRGYQQPKYGREWRS